MGTIENRDICSECGGKCCKECGCSYAPSDFKDGLTLEKVLEKIATGTVSIAALFGWSRENNKTILRPVLLLKEKDIGKGDIDLISIPGKCISLTDTGCSYDFDSRPLGGACVIPNTTHNCLKSVSTNELAEMWYPYKDIMIKATEIIGQDNINNILLTQLEQFFFDIKVAIFESRPVPKTTLELASGLEDVCVEQSINATVRLVDYLQQKPAYVKKVSSYVKSIFKFRNDS